MWDFFIYQLLLQLVFDTQEQASTEYQNSIRKIARWVNKLIGKLDLTPSDSALALLLVATLQRKARRQALSPLLALALNPTTPSQHACCPLDGVHVPSVLIFILLSSECRRQLNKSPTNMQSLLS